MAHFNGEDGDLQEFDDELNDLMFGMEDLHVEPPRRHDRITTVFNPLYQSSTTDSSESSDASNPQGLRGDPFRICPVNVFQPPLQPSSSDSSGVSNPRAIHCARGPQVNVLHHFQPTGSSCESGESRPKRKVSFSIPPCHGDSRPRSTLAENLGSSFASSTPVAIPANSCYRRYSGFSTSSSDRSKSSGNRGAVSSSPQSSPWSCRPSPESSSWSDRPSPSPTSGSSARGDLLNPSMLIPVSARAPPSQFIAQRTQPTTIIAGVPSSPEWEGGVIREANMTPPVRPRMGQMERSPSYDGWFSATLGGMFQRGDPQGDPQLRAALTPFVHNVELDIYAARNPTIHDNFPAPGNTSQTIQALEQMTKLLVEIQGVLRNITDCHEPSHQRRAHDNARYCAILFQSIVNLYKACMFDVNPHVFTMSNTCLNSLTTAVRRQDRSVSTLSSLACKLIRASQVLFQHIDTVRCQQATVRQRTSFDRNLRRIDFPEVDHPLSPSYTTRTV